MAALLSERVLAVRHWTDTQFTFSTTRSAGLRFENGQFVMLGLPLSGRPLLRAYSIASANHEEHLEFLSIKVPDGPLTSRLQHVHAGDEILVSAKPTGTLLLSDLRPGRRLYLIATGTVSRGIPKRHAVTGADVAVQLMLLEMLNQRATGAVDDALRHPCRARGEQDEERVIERESLEPHVVPESGIQELVPHDGAVEARNRRL